MIWIAVGLGSAIGGLLRFALAQAFASRAPWPILAINVVGGFLIGYLLRTPLPPLWRVFLIPGFCGGFTTFSTFSADTLELWQQSPIRAILYVLISVGLSIAATWLGTVTRRS
ncbi:MAG: fluoride efflux transporter CrcB [Bryobacteraceae bacterium]|nr:fluoride efflux transporter CrcB [Bryobacteraceae bacterium]